MNDRPLGDLFARNERSRDETLGDREPDAKPATDEVLPNTRMSHARTSHANAAYASQTLSSARILLVDDQESVLVLLRHLLAQAGYKHVRCVDDSRQVLSHVATFQPDLVVLDINMPFVSGLEVLDALRAARQPFDYLPVLMMTSLASEDVRLRALESGVSDFLAKPFQKIDLLLRVRNLLETRFLNLALQSRNRVLESAVERRTRELAAALGRVTQSHEEALSMIGLSLEYRDYETKGHTDRVARAALALAAALGLDAAASAHLRWGAYLHDIGKMALPDHILLKPGSLTPQEYALVRTHVTRGEEMLRQVSFLPTPVRQVVRHHHEHWNGHGYPDRLRGGDIPLPARIFAVTDVYDALVSKRPYKESWTPEAARGELLKQRGEQFDPAVVDAFLKLEALTMW